jgi:hypothetical protein
MTDTAKFMQEALRDIEMVKSEPALMGWHDLYFTSLEYLHLSADEAKKLEEAYQNKAAWFWGVGAG